MQWQRGHSVHKWRNDGFTAPQCLQLNPVCLRVSDATAPERKMIKDAFSSSDSRFTKFSNNGASLGDHVDVEDIFSIRPLNYH